MIRISQRDAEAFLKALQQRYPDVELGLSFNPKLNRIDLHKIVVPKEKRKRGIGSAIMKELVDYAKQHGHTITLYPSAEFGGTSKNRLKDFYKGFGFVENKGRNKDFTLSDPMYFRQGKP